MTPSKDSMETRLESAPRPRGGPRATDPAEAVQGTAETGAGDEAGLIARAQHGDAAAFRVLVDLHRDRAYGLALRMLRSERDAEEVAQDGFVRAWRALPSFRGESRFATWLHRIVARRALDRAAVLKGRRERETVIEAADGVAAGGSSEAAAERAMLARRFERLLERLSVAQRAAVTLYYYEGRSVEQAAVALGMPENTVKTHLMRARAALRVAWLESAMER